MGHREVTHLLPYLQPATGPSEPWAAPRLSQYCRKYIMMCSSQEKRTSCIYPQVTNVNISESNNPACGSFYLSMCHGEVKKSKVGPTRLYVTVLWPMTGPCLRSERPWKSGLVLDQRWSLGLRKQNPLTQFSTGQPPFPILN